MHKDDVSKKMRSCWAKHTGNGVLGRRGINKSRRQKEKEAIRKEIILRTNNR